MKVLTAKIFFITFIFAAVLPLAAFAQVKTTDIPNNNYEFEKKWQAIDRCLEQGLPESALKLIDTIQIIALQKNDYPQFVKAIFMRPQIWRAYKEEASAIAIDYLDKQIPLAKSPVKEILYSVKAQTLLEFFLKNNYAIQQRSSVENADSLDFIYWDAATFKKEIIKNYKLSLQNIAITNNVKTEDITVFLIKTNNAGQNYLPALFDILAYRALQAFSSLSSDKQFKLNKPVYFAKSNDFIAATIAATDTNLIQYQILKLYQEIERLKYNDTLALADIELRRLDFVLHNSWRKDKDSLYVNTLQEEIADKKMLPLVARFMYTLASFYNNYYAFQLTPFGKTGKAMAVEVAESAIEKFPGSPFANNCRNLIAEIKAPSFSFSMDKTLLPGSKTPVNISYKNIDTLFYKVYKLDEKQEKTFFEQADLSKQKAIIDEIQNPLFSDKVALANNQDFIEYSTSFSLPSLKNGFYVMVVAQKDILKDTNNIVFKSFWVSEIACITKNENKRFKGIVINRKTGKPIANAKIKAVTSEYDYNTGKFLWEDYLETSSDKNGNFYFDKSGNRNKNFALEIVAQKDRWRDNDNAANYIAFGYDYYEKVFDCRLFTDRAIYRPGQKVCFKGILMFNGKQKQLAAGETIEVRLKAVNGVEISKIQVNTNEYGSFSGEFVLPQNVLNGQMYIQTAWGSEYFSVEAYKRPSFDITLKSIEKPYKLGDTVVITGLSKNFSGSAVASALVNYEISQTPDIIYNRTKYQMSETMIVAQGTLKTDQNGAFSLKFATEKNDTENENEAYSYTLDVYITDITGETQHVEKSIRIANRPLQIIFDIPPFLDAAQQHQLPVIVQNTNGIKVNTMAAFKLYSLKKDTTPPEQRPKTLVTAFDFRTDEMPFIALPQLQQGEYAFELTAKDSSGNAVVQKGYFNAFLKNAKNTLAKSFYAFVAHEKVEAGENIELVIGSPQKTLRLLLEVHNDDSLLKREWITINNQQKLIKILVPENCRGNVNIQLIGVKDNKWHTFNQSIAVPYTNKQLALSINSFKSVLTPGTPEEWTVVLRGNNKKPAKAEMLAAMYDASLDAFRANEWYFDIFSKDPNFSIWQSSFNEKAEAAYYANIAYLPNYYLEYEDFLWSSLSHRHLMTASNSVVPNIKTVTAKQEEKTAVRVSSNNDGTASLGKSPEIILENPIRSNLNETAFFYPQLKASDSGEVIIKFNAPEALTKWKLMLLAHDKNLNNVIFDTFVITKKNLMCFPNIPRFVRENDEIVIEAKIANISDAVINGFAILELFDAATLKPLAGVYQSEANIRFSVEKDSNINCSWKIKIPENISGFIYQILAKSENISDGQDGIVPVLPSQILLTETNPLNLNADNRKYVQTIHNSKENYAVTLELATNPAWFALQALPYMLDNKNETSLDIFSAFYASAITQVLLDKYRELKKNIKYSATLNPDMWQSELEKNQSLKNIFLEQTPWVLDAAHETNQMQKTAQLFSDPDLPVKGQYLLTKLFELQNSDGSFSWIKDGPRDNYITQQILFGFANLAKIGTLYTEMGKTKSIVNAVLYTDAQMNEEYERLVVLPQNTVKIEPMHIQYLYIRQCFPEINQSNEKVKKVIAYFSGLLNTQWAVQPNYLKALAAIWANNDGNQMLAQKIIKSFKETALKSELGIYWKSDLSQLWYQSPVETQAMIINAFQQIEPDDATVKAMKQWLITNRVTNKWNSSRASVDAVFALLNHADTSFLSPAPLLVVAGKDTIAHPFAVKNNSYGYLKKYWTAEELRAKNINSISVENKGNGIIFGGFYRQYFESLENIKKSEDNLKINKEFYVQQKDYTLKKLDHQLLNVGDKLLVRLQIGTDRDLSYVCLQDCKAAATEVFDKLSGYHYQDKLSYYQTVSDAGISFFFTNIPKGKYIIEYEMIITQAGTFSIGPATIQCLYAPQFSAHSAAQSITINND